jgi:hypothetical protein
VSESTPTPTPSPTPKSFTKYSADQIPFSVGERLEMDLNWMALPAGRATIEVRSAPSNNGKASMELWGNVLSSKLADAIYHIDNTIESLIDAETLLPFKFLLHMSETHQKKETRVVFDHDAGKAYYWSKRLSERWGNEDQDRVDEFTPGSFDMWSALYHARLLNYTLNQKQSFRVYENRQLLDVELTTVANEFMNTKVGAFQCWKILVNIKLNNILRPTGDIFLWLSDDFKKYPVKFDAKIKIGSLYGNLVSIQ